MSKELEILIRLAYDDWKRLDDKYKEMEKQKKRRHNELMGTMGGTNWEMDVIDEAIHNVEIKRSYYRGKYDGLMEASGKHDDSEM